MLIKLAMVVSVACLCALFYLLPNNSSDLLIDQIAREVAKNHVHLKPLEVTSTEFSKVRSYFKNLDFLPFPSKTLDSSFNMQGGRYCSIQSIAAAQLRYQTESGEIVTIYEVDYQPAKFGKIPHIQTGEKPIQTFALGLSVTLWVENGVMMAKVKKAD